MLAAGRSRHNVTMTASTPLQSDVPCARCGYDLRGLIAESCCPECGESIARSVDAAGKVPLAAADRRWLRRIAIAPLLLVLALLLDNSLPFWPATGGNTTVCGAIVVPLLVSSAPLWSWLAAWRLGADRNREALNHWHRVPCALFCAACSSIWRKDTGVAAAAVAVVQLPPRSTGSCPLCSTGPAWRTTMACASARLGSGDSHFRCAGDVSTPLHDSRESSGNRATPSFAGGLGDINALAISASRLAIASG